MHPEESLDRLISNFNQFDYFVPEIPTPPIQPSSDITTVNPDLVKRRLDHQSATPNPAPLKRPKFEEKVDEACSLLQEQDEIISELSKLLSVNDKYTRQLEFNVNSLFSLRDEQQIQINNFKKYSQQQNEIIAKFDRENMVFKQRNAYQNIEITVAKEENQMLKGEIESQRKENTKLSEMIERLNEELATQKQENKSQKEQITTLKREKEQLETDLFFQLQESQKGFFDTKDYQ